MVDRDSYPTGKTGKLPMGMPTDTIPGSGARGDSIIKDRGAVHPRSASNCADKIANMIPGAASKTETH